MPVSYTNRKGLTYTLYRGQTKTGKPRYYFGREGQSQGEPVMEHPPARASTAWSPWSKTAPHRSGQRRWRPSRQWYSNILMRAGTGLPPSTTGSRSTSKPAPLRRSAQRTAYGVPVETGPRRGAAGPGGAPRAVHAGAALHSPRSGAAVRRGADVLPGEYRRLDRSEANGIRGGVGPYAHSHPGHGPVL